MNGQELREMVAEILETDANQLQETSELESFTTYDSVARLTLMVGLSDFTGKPVTIPELMKLHTYGDVISLVRSSSTNGHNS